MARTSNNTNPSANDEGDTGLLTRWIPAKLKHSAPYRWLLRLIRIFQFLAAVISLGLFSARLYKVYRLVNSIKALVTINSAFGAVEGILAAAVLYTLVSMLMTLLLRGGGPKWLRWLWVLLDILFVCAFIAVSVLTSPNGGMAGPRQCYENRDPNSNSNNNLTEQPSTTTSDNCNLPWGTFILAIISTLLHAVTAAFHEGRDRYKQHQNQDKVEQDNIAAEQQRQYQYEAR